MSNKLALGLAFLWLAAVLLFGTPQKTQELQQVAPDYTFASEPVKIDQGLLLPQEGDTPQRVIIPDLKIDLVVKTSRIIKGYWEVFANSAGWGEGSGLPGKPGNQVIFAHARVGLFLPLKEVKVGMKVYVLTDNEWFSYEIREIKEVLPNQIEVIAPTEDETLTLYTCSGFADEKRLIAIAKRV